VGHLVHTIVIILAEFLLDALVFEFSVFVVLLWLVLAVRVVFAPNILHVLFIVNHAVRVLEIHNLS